MFKTDEFHFAIERALSNSLAANLRMVSQSILTQCPPQEGSLEFLSCTCVDPHPSLSSCQSQPCIIREQSAQWEAELIL
jgi:hypothetical protein